MNNYSSSGRKQSNPFGFVADGEESAAPTVNDMATKMMKDYAIN